MKKKIIIKDWYILPAWGRGLAIGTIIGAILMIPPSLLIKTQSAAPLPLAILLTCSIAGLLIARNKKSFGLKHK